MSTSVSVRLPDKTAKALDDLSKATNRPRTYFIEKAWSPTSPSTRTTRWRSIGCGKGRPDHFVFRDEKADGRRAR